MTEEIVDLCSGELSYPPIAVLIAQFFFLFVFGYQVRQPYDFISQLVDLGISLLLVNQLFAIPSEIDVVILCQNRLRLMLTEWTVLVVSASAAIHYIQRKSLATRIAFLVACWWMLAVITFLLSLDSLLIPPILRLDMSYCVASLLALCSAVYRYSLDLPTLKKCIEIIAEGYLSIAIQISDTIKTEPRVSKKKPGTTTVPNSEVAESPGLVGSIESPLQGSTEIRHEFHFEYKYEILKSDEIRLLKLLPHKPTDGLAVEIKHRSLSDFHPTRRETFAALSYHWGDHSETTEMLINGKKCTVTMNVYLALCEVEGRGHDLLWVDALCIDQRNTNERNAQVMRMYSIYQNAHPVVTWLGRPTTESKSVMTMLNETEDFDSIQHFDGKSCAASLRDIKEFFARVYFQRTWVVQEIACAAKAVFLCCEKTTTIEQIEKLVGKMENLEVIKNDSELQESLDAVRGLLKIRKNAPLPLLEALFCTQNRKAHIQHDKVFALLNLATDAKNYVIEPNYHLSEIELCKQMTRNWITSKRRLDIILIGRRQGLGNNRKLPSWCPDFLSFGQAVLDRDTVNYLCARDKRYRMGKECEFWSATNNSDVDIDLLVPKENDKILNLRGICLGRIVSAGPCTSDAEVGYNDIEQRSPQNTEAGSLSVYNAICRLLLIYDKKYDPLTKRPTLLFMLYNIAYNMYMSISAEKDPGSNQALVNLWLRRNRNYVINGWKLKEHGWASFWITPKNFLTSLFDTSAKTLTIADYSHVIKYIAMIVREDMRLVILHNGMVGWAHNAVKCGDEVFLLAGCTVPAVLRREGNYYSVVGRAYVDNCMDGSAWKENEIHHVSVC